MDFRELLRSKILELENTEHFKRLQRVLNEKKWYKPLLDYSEKSSSLNRVYIVTSVSLVLLTLLLYHFGIQLICGAVGFLYPAYQTIGCLEEFDVQKGKRWLTYWLIFSAVNFLEILLFCLHWLPGYWIVKCIFYAWCYIPVQTNGSDVIYSFIIWPLFVKNRGAIDEAINTVIKNAHAIVTDPNLKTITNANHHD